MEWKSQYCNDIKCTLIELHINGIPIILSFFGGNGQAEALYMEMQKEQE